MDDIDRWLRSVLWDNKLPESEGKGDFEIHRCKGRVVLQNGGVTMLQGVREVFELTEPPGLQEPLPETGKIILIGRKIAEVDFESSLKRAIKHDQG